MSAFHRACISRYYFSFLRLPSLSQIRFYHFLYTHIQKVKTSLRMQDRLSTLPFLCALYSSAVSLLYSIVSHLTVYSFVFISFSFCFFFNSFLSRFISRFVLKAKQAFLVCLGGTTRTHRQGTYTQSPHIAISTPITLSSKATHHNRE